MIYSECPNCCAHIKIKKAPSIGLPVKCGYCNVQLEIIWLYPVTLDYPEKQPQSLQDAQILVDFT